MKRKSYQKGDVGAHVYDNIILICWKLDYSKLQTLHMMCKNLRVFVCLDFILYIVFSNKVFFS